MTKKLSLPVLLLALSLLFPISSHAETASLYFNSTKNTSEPGVSQDVDIVVDTSSTPASGFIATISYPANLIQINSVEPSAAFSTVFNKTIDPSMGKITLQMVSMTNTKSLPSGKITVARVNFTPKSTGNGSLEFKSPIEIVGTNQKMPVNFSVYTSKYNLKVDDKKSFWSVILNWLKLKY